MDLIDLMDQAIRLDHYPISQRMSSKIKYPIFIVGSPRSGTTILAKSLGSHSKMVADDESLFLLGMWDVYISLLIGRNTKGSKPLSGYISEDRMIQAIGDLSDGIFSGLLDKKDTALYYIDHTPWYGAIIPFISSIFPDLRVIHIVRDGRAVLRSLTASYERGYGWAGSTQIDRAKLWSSMVGVCQKNCRTLREDQCRTVQYETFCSSPDTVLKGLLDWLDLPMQQSCLERLAIPEAAPSRPESTIATVATDGTLVFPALTQDANWPSMSSERELTELKGLMTPQLVAFGYELENDERATSFDHRLAIDSPLR